MKKGVKILISLLMLVMELFCFMPNAVVLADSDGLYYVGTIEQDGYPDNGAEAIEWIPIAEEADAVLLLAKNVVECTKYNDIRQCLNELYDSFSTSEKSKVIKTSEGELFLLTRSDLDNFGLGPDVKSGATTQVRYRISIINDAGNVAWWLGDVNREYVDVDATVKDAVGEDYLSLGIRPAMWFSK